MEDQTTPGQDRRAGLRVVTAGKVPGELVIDEEANVVQISLGGVMAEISTPLSVGSEHHLVLVIEDEELNVNGVVRNCQRSSDGEVVVYRVGIEFCELGWTEREALAAFVNRKLKT